MPTSDYNSAGSAFADRMTEYLMHAEELKRQAALDQLQVRKQAHAESLAERKLEMDQQQHAADLELKRSQLTSIDDTRKAQREALIEAGIRKKTDEVQARINGMLPGDIPDAQMVQHADELGLGQQFPKPQAQSMPGLVAPGAGPIAARIAPQGPEPVAQMGLTGTSDPIIRPFIGTKEQRDKKEAQQALDAYANTLPEGSAARQVVEAKRHGVTLTAADLKIDKPTATRQLMLDPATRQFTDAQGHVVTDVTKDDAVHMLPSPKDTSARDAVLEQSKQVHLDAMRKDAHTELNNRAKPIEDLIGNLNKFDTSINQGTNIADSTLAEQIVKITAGGLGSGVRISQPMIDQVMKKTRTVWGDLQMKMQQLSANPNASIIFDAGQKQAMRDLMTMIREKANATHAKIIATRRKVDAADDTSTINKHIADLEEELAAPPSPATPASPTALPPGVTVRKVPK